MPDTDAALIAFAQLCDEKRERQGLSVRKAAERAGFSEGYWRSLVLGRRVVRGVEVPMIAKAEKYHAMGKAVGVEDAVERLRAILGEAALPNAKQGSYSQRTVVSPITDDDVLLYQRPAGVSDADWEVMKEMGRSAMETYIRARGLEPQ